LDPHRLVTLTQAAGLTGLSSEALRLRIKRGSLHAVRGNDGRHLVRVSDLADLTPSRDQLRPPMTGQLRPDATAPDWPVADQSPPPGDTVPSEVARRLLDRINSLEASLEAEREGRATDREAAAAERVQVAEAHGRELAELRERVGRAEAEKDAVIREAAATKAQAEAELAAWSEGGPIARAMRALMWRRG
jgi:flagellar biosynthesis/type III secretory pathway protein FliH